MRAPSQPSGPGRSHNRVLRKHLCDRRHMGVCQKWLFSLLCQTQGGPRWCPKLALWGVWTRMPVDMRSDLQVIVATVANQSSLSPPPDMGDCRTGSCFAVVQCMCAGYQLTHHHLVHPITFPICPSITKSGKPVSALSPFVSEPASAQKAVFLKLFDKNCKNTSLFSVFDKHAPKTHAFLSVLHESCKKITRFAALR